MTLAKPGFGSKRAAARIAAAGEPCPVPPPVRQPLRLRVAEVGEKRRHGRVPRALARAVPPLAVAVRHREGARPRPRLVRRARAPAEPADPPRRRLHPDRRRLEPTRVTRRRRSRSPRRSGPGLYYFHARTASGTFFGFPWVVAPASPTARGRGDRVDQHVERVQQLRRPQQLHQPDRAAAGADGERPPGPGALQRAATASGVPTNDEYAAAVLRPPGAVQPHPVRDVQPDDPIRGRQACHLAEAEWRLLAWMEREGFAYDLYADHQLHAGELDLDAYRVLVHQHAPGVLVARARSRA